MDRWTWLALFGLCGCTALPSPPIAVHTYLFSAPFPAPRRGPGPVLLIATPRAAPGYDRPGIAYRRSPTRLGYYAESEWADEPARLIEPLIIAAAEASGAFEAVVSAGTGLIAEMRLDTEIEGAVAAIDTALARVLEQVVAFCLDTTVDHARRGDL
ncbi:MAG: ABC-type transport auxiliary lipoprotein family protein [Beggiatoa sp.]|nr:ABC-type transport auxiliary lipoprotein family protein [Beggiatoa sp.]